MRPVDRRAMMAMLAAAAIATSASAARGYDIVITGGRVIDPARGIDATLDVAIAGGRIAAIGRRIAAGAARVIDARGKLVLPGLIDIHTHASLSPDSPAQMLATGVTGWIEAGAQGADTIAAGVAAVHAAPQTAALLVNIGRGGVIDTGSEIADLAQADPAAAAAAIAAHPEVIGVKARLGRGISGDNDIEVVRRAIAAASPSRKPVMIHIGGNAVPLGATLDLLRAGDIVTHLYAPRPNAIVDDAGRPIPQAIAARARGVRFDWGHGTRGHVAWEVVEAAVRHGFLPDTLSTDWTANGARRDVTLPMVMSAMLSFGVPLPRVVAMVTSEAARSFPLFRGRGTLAPSAPADVAVLELRSGRYELLDTGGAKRVASAKLFPVATMLGGRLVETASTPPAAVAMVRR